MPAQPATGAQEVPANQRQLRRQAISLLFTILASQVPLPDTLRAAGLRGLELLCELHDLARSRPGVRATSCY